MGPAVMWFRRDLRLCDHPALHQAAEAGGGSVVPVFVSDDRLAASGTARATYLAASLARLSESMGGSLIMLAGNPAEQLERLVRDVGADTVHVSADFGPYGSGRDDEVRRRLAELDVELVATGSPYAVDPGTVRNAEGNGYAVFSPFYRAWRKHGWDKPLGPAPVQSWVGADVGEQLPAAPETPAEWSEPGEDAARRRWAEYSDPDGGGAGRYDAVRDRPDLDATSRLSAHLRWGEIHPRTVLADLDPDASKAHDRLAAEVAWREFFADVLHHHPRSSRDWYRPEFADMQLDDLDEAVVAERVKAWQEGRTGYPFVDAGMRQLLREGWMHNRVRMVTASFLVKDLHVHWRVGAAWFMRHLIDGDLASNQLGWQWVAGSGTDAAPYFRVFNPVKQGLRFDPEGDYVRRYVPELRHVGGATVHEPWDVLDGQEHGYPDPIVDHAEERVESLRRFEEIKKA